MLIRVTRKKDDRIVRVPADRIVIAGADFNPTDGEFTTIVVDNSAAPVMLQVKETPDDIANQIEECFS